MRIITWNTQGNAFAQGKLNRIALNYNPDIICLQECGRLSEIIDFERYARFSPIYYGCCNLGTTRREKQYHIFYYPWRNECRCTMATMIKAEYSVVRASLKYNDYRSSYADRRMYHDDIYDFFSEEDDDVFHNDNSDRRGLRGMLQTIIELDSNCGQDYLSVNNVHLPSGCPKFAMKVAKSFFNRCRNYHSNVIMTGDMNIPSWMWKDTAVRYRLVAPATKTHQKGSILDYAFTDLLHEDISVHDDFCNSDHLPVIIDF